MIVLVFGALLGAQAADLFTNFYKLVCYLRIALQ
jgi:hypothetical protein